MGLHPELARRLVEAGIALEVDLPLAKKVWWRVGGPADGYAEVGTLSDLQLAIRACGELGVAWTVVGNGSNLLVADAGVRGLVLRLTDELAASTEADGVLTVGAGLRNNVLLARAAKAGWTGLGSLVGIPGTVGGAVRMNAGSTMGEISDVLIDVGLVMPDGSLERRSAASLGMRYRHGGVPEGACVFEARLRLTGEDSGAYEAATRAFLDRRKATQPLDMPSCGSTFTNPPGDAAGRLIDACGLKGFTIGGAQVSTKHANFVVNTGEATARDIRAVIEHVRAVVAREKGVVLHPEVVMIGDWGDDVADPAAC